MLLYRPMYSRKDSIDQPSVIISEDNKRGEGSVRSMLADAEKKINLRAIANVLKTETTNGYNTVLWWCTEGTV